MLWPECLLASGSIHDKLAFTAHAPHCGPEFDVGDGVQPNPWPEFFSTLIWQLIVIGVLLFFRRQIGGLLARMAHFKVGDTEVTFQVPVDDAPVPPAAPADAPAAAAHAPKASRSDPDGFLTRSSVLATVQDSGLIGEGESVVEPFLLFRTNKQRTWLVTSTRNLFCILDDENTRASGRTIQWREPLERLTSVGTRSYREAVGRLDIGPRSGWLYSTSLHPSPSALTADVEALIRRAATQD